MDKTQETTDIRKETMALRGELAEQKQRLFSEIKTLAEKVTIPLYDVAGCLLS